MCVDGSWRLGSGARRRIVAHVTSSQRAGVAEHALHTLDVRPRGHR